MVNHDLKNPPNYTKRFKLDNQPWRTKLETHKAGGSTRKITDDDWVSVGAGGLGQTFHYEGPQIPNGLSCHTIQMWRDLIQGVTSPYMTIPTVK